MSEFAVQQLSRALRFFGLCIVRAAVIVKMNTSVGATTEAVQEWTSRDNEERE